MAPRGKFERRRTKAMASGGVLVVTTYPSDPAREDEFRRWYLDMHIPDVLETPGIRTGRLYEIQGAAEGEARFLAVYELEGEPNEVFENLKAHMAVIRERGRLIDTLAVSSLHVCKNPD